MLAQLVSFLFLSELSNNKDGPQCGPAVLTISCQTLKQGSEWRLSSLVKPLCLTVMTVVIVVISKYSMVKEDFLNCINRYFQWYWCNPCCCSVDWCWSPPKCKTDFNKGNYIKKFFHFSCTSSSRLPTMKTYLKSLWEFSKMSVCMLSHHILSELIIHYMLVIKQNTGLLVYEAHNVRALQFSQPTI